MQSEKTRWQLGPPSKNLKCLWKRGYVTPQTEAADAWSEWIRLPKKQNFGLDKNLTMDISWKDPTTFFTAGHHRQLVITINRHSAAVRKAGHHWRLVVTIDHHSTTDRSESRSLQTARHNRSSHDRSESRPSRTAHRHDLSLLCSRSESRLSRLVGNCVAVQKVGHHGQLVVTIYHHCAADREAGHHGRVDTIYRHCAAGRNTGLSRTDRQDRSSHDRSESRLSRLVRNCVAVQKAGHHGQLVVTIYHHCAADREDGHHGRVVTIYRHCSAGRNAGHHGRIVRIDHHTI